MPHAHAQANRYDQRSAANLLTPAPVRLHYGQMRFDAPTRETTCEAPGLKLVILLEGGLRYTLDGRRPVDASGPSLHVAMNRHPLSQLHEYSLHRTLRFVKLDLPAATLRELGFSQAQFSTLGDAARREDFDHAWRLDVAMRALGRQILSCPLQGQARLLYQSGKALEILALLRDRIDHDLGRGSPATALAPADLERLHAARDILRQRFGDPPSLRELARAVGLNVNKLTTGFRRLFGQTVYEHVRDLRLNHAHHLLSTRAVTVGQAAYLCGYTDSHFSKVFQRRFGVSPRGLRY